MSTKSKDYMVIHTDQFILSDRIAKEFEKANIPRLLSMVPSIYGASSLRSGSSTLESMEENDEPEFVDGLTNFEHPASFYAFILGSYFDEIKPELLKSVETLESLFPDIRDLYPKEEYERLEAWGSTLFVQRIKNLGKKRNTPVYIYGLDEGWGEDSMGITLAEVCGLEYYASTLELLLPRLIEDIKRREKL